MNYTSCNALLTHELRLMSHTKHMNYVPYNALLTHELYVMPRIKHMNYASCNTHSHVILASRSTLTNHTWFLCHASHTPNEHTLCIKQPLHTICSIPQLNMLDKDKQITTCSRRAQLIMFQSQHILDLKQVTCFLWSKKFRHVETTYLYSY